MPIYEYICQKCEREIVVEHPMDKEAETCSQIDWGCVAQAPVKKKLYTPDIQDNTNNRSSGQEKKELTRDQLEKRVARGIEEMRDRAKKERMKIDVDDLRNKK